MLNVVAVRNLVKTVAIEKEVFSCFDSSSTLAQVKEVDTLIELTARGEPGRGEAFVPLTKTVNADSCTKLSQNCRKSFGRYWCFGKWRICPTAKSARSRVRRSALSCRDWHEDAAC